jgi:hypothetical protein
MVFKNYQMEKIQDGDWDTATDCVSSVNKGLC